MNHDLTLCAKDPNRCQYHYKNWSMVFVCATCQREGRFNLNFLGRRAVFCDGRRFVKQEVPR